MSQNFEEACMVVVEVVVVGGWGISLNPHHTNVCKILRLCGAISSMLILEVSPLNLVSYPI